MVPHDEARRLFFDGARRLARCAGFEKILPDLSYDLCVTGDYRGDEISRSPEPDWAG